MVQWETLIPPARRRYARQHQAGERKPHRRIGPAGAQQEESPTRMQAAAMARNQWTPTVAWKQRAHTIPKAKLADSAARGDLNRVRGLRSGKLSGKELPPDRGAKPQRRLASFRNGTVVSQSVPNLHSWPGYLLHVKAKWLM